MKSLRYIAIISFAFVALIASIFIIGDVLTRLPQEAKITGDFYARRSVYDQLLTMLSEDKDVRGVAIWGVDASDDLVWKIPPDGGMAVKRYQEYLELLKEMGARAVSISIEPGEVRFLVWGSGFAGGLVIFWHMRLSYGYVRPQRLKPN